jgi:cysteine-rich repeat protein
MRLRVVAPLALLGALGCSTLLGVEFDDYREGARDGGGTSPTQCVPDSVSRCLCELAEGLQRCDGTGRLGPCVCGDDASIPRCGDGVIDEGEACDDGNLDDGDGCSAGCVPDGRPSSVEQCTGQPVVIGANAHIGFQVVGAIKKAYAPLEADTGSDEPSDGGGQDAGEADASSDDTGEDASANDAGLVDAGSDDAGIDAAVTADAGGGADAGACGGNAPPDRVFALIPSVSGRLEVSVTASVPTFVWLREVCDSPVGASCGHGAAAQPIRQHLEVTQGKPVYLLLEPIEASPTATFLIELTATAP